ncbi:MAG: diguanylate cyclase [Chloroflexi bacterium]|nr:diguanylate cyclase [Chloroflexota bacterium]
MKVLIVEDDPISLKLLSGTLSQLNYDVVEAKNGVEAWQILQQRTIRLVITDWVMPEMDGITLTRLIRETEMAGYIYIIVLTGRQGIENIVDGLDAGADDYMIKPFDPKELSSRLHIGARILDLEQRLKGAYERMYELAMHDELTGLWNRRAFYTHAQSELERSERMVHALSILLLDIDHFKLVNDRYGHLVGDRALIMLAETITKNLRSYDRAGRWGGEEFIILLPETSLNEAVEIAERLRIQVMNARLPVHVEDQDNFDDELGIEISLGVATLNLGSAVSLDQLFDAADEMLYLAKRQGRNRVCYQR